MREGPATLRVPDGRQGPGPMPSALVEALDLPIAHRAAGQLPGDRRAAGVGVDGRSEPHALAHALGRVGRIAVQPGFVVVVSDFRGYHDWTTMMGALRMRHSVLAVEVRDPRETALPAVGRLALIDPETGERIEVDSNHRALRERFAQAERADRDKVASELRRLRVDHAILSTDGDWLFELGRALR